MERGGGRGAAVVGDGEQVFLGVFASALLALDHDRAAALGHAQGVATSEAATTALVPPGDARVVLQLLRLKFGPLAPEIEERVSSADAERLLEWSGRILTAESLQDILRS